MVGARCMACLMAQSPLVRPSVLRFLDNNGAASLDSASVKAALDGWRAVHGVLDGSVAFGAAVGAAITVAVRIGGEVSGTMRRSSHLCCCSYTS